MNLIQILVQVLLTFGAKSAKQGEISAVLSVLVAVAEALMDELHSREKLGIDPNTALQFHPRVQDRLAELNKATAHKGGTLRVKTKKPRTLS